MSQRLTVDIVRRKYWDKKTETGKPIRMYIAQDFKGGSINGKDNEIFIPDGDLIHRTYKFKKSTIEHKDEIIENWLSTSKDGPYKKSDKGKSLPDFYYLSGMYMCGKDKYAKGMLQICSGPLNIISQDCFDSVDCWIKK